MDMFVIPGSFPIEVREDNYGQGFHIPFPRITMRARLMADGGFALEYVVWDTKGKQVSTSVIPYEKRGENWVAINKIQDFFPDVCMPGSLEHEFFMRLEEKAKQVKNK